MKLELITSQTFDDIYPLLEISFPKEERKSYAGQKALLARSDYALWTWEYKTLAACYELDDYLFIEHLAVDPSLRNQGIGSQFLETISAHTNKNVCLEVEYPTDEITRRRIRFYQRHHFILNDQFEYALPPLEKGYPFVPLHIMSTTSLHQDSFDALKHKLYKDVYRYID